MIIRELSAGALALLDTSYLRRPTGAIESWMAFKGPRWALNLDDNEGRCIGLLLAQKVGGDVCCTALEIAATQPEDTVTYALVNALCDTAGELPPNTLLAQFNQINKGVLEALSVMGVKVPTRRQSTTAGPKPNHSAA